MTEKARRHDGEEARDERESLPAEMSHELAPERDPQRDLTGATTHPHEETEDVQDSQDVPAPADASAGVSAGSRARRASRKAPAAQARKTEDGSEGATEHATIEEMTAEATDVTALTAIEADRVELEAQGFTPEEADRLIEVSKRLETSAEARASQAELKRLRFTQWLIERGILDEFSA